LQTTFGLSISTNAPLTLFLKTVGELKSALKESCAENCEAEILRWVRMDQTVREETGLKDAESGEIEVQQ